MRDSSGGSTTDRRMENDDQKDDRIGMCLPLAVNMTMTKGRLQVGWRMRRTACCGDCRKFVDCSLVLSVFLPLAFGVPTASRPACCCRGANQHCSCWRSGVRISHRTLPDEEPNTDRDFFEFATDLTAAGSALPQQPLPLRLASCHGSEMGEHSHEF